MDEKHEFVHKVAGDPRSVEVGLGREGKGLGLTNTWVGLSEAVRFWSLLREGTEEQ